MQRSVPGARHAPIRALAALALLLTLGTMPACAAASSQDWTSDDRTVTAWPQGGGFTVRSTRDSGAGSDEIDAAYDAQAASLRVALQATSPDTASMAVSLSLRAVSEFRDTDGDGRLGPGEEVVRRVAIPGTPAVASLEATPDGGWRATSTHSLPATADGGAPTLAQPRLEVTVEARGQDTAGMDPTQLSVDLRLLDGWALNGTHLALEADYATDQPPESVSADTARVREHSLSLDTAWQDGQGTVVEGSDPRTVSFVRAQPAGHVVAFPLAVAAAWHPSSLGGHAPSGSVLLYVGAAVLASAAIAYPAWRRLRT